jgi:hypothetical protein
MDTEPLEMPEIEDVYKEPSVDRVGNVTFIGVDHAVNLSEQHRPSLKVLDTVGHADHLLIEGATMPTPGIKPNINYELLTTIAFQNRGKEADIHMLEEGTEPAVLAEKYGLDRRHYLLLNYYRMTYGALDQFLQENEPSGLADYKDLFITDLIAFGVSQSAPVPIDELQEIIRHVVETDVRLLQDGALDTRHYLAAAAYQMNNDFLSPIRDYETLYPKIRDYDKALPGEKAVIIGGNHIPGLLDAFEKGKTEPPRNWRQFLNGLEGIAKESFESFDDIVVGKEKVKPWNRRPQSKS